MQRADRRGDPAGICTAGPDGRGGGSGLPPDLRVDYGAGGMWSARWSRSKGHDVQGDRKSRPSFWMLDPRGASGGRRSCSGMTPRRMAEAARQRDGGRAGLRSTSTWAVRRPKIAGNRCGSGADDATPSCAAGHRGGGVRRRWTGTGDGQNTQGLCRRCGSQRRGGGAVPGRGGRGRRRDGARPHAGSDVRPSRGLGHHPRRQAGGVGFPVIGNGDVDGCRRARQRLYEETGCDGIMVGRGALGAPWIFAQIEAYLGHGTLLPDPPVAKRMAVLFRQAELTAQLEGGARGAARNAQARRLVYARTARCGGVSPRRGAADDAGGAFSPVPPRRGGAGRRHALRLKPFGKKE